MSASGLERLATEWQDLPFPDTPALPYARQMHARPFDYYVRRIRKLGLGGERVLDAGSGTGTWSFALRQSFEDVLGVDRNAPRVDMARWIADRYGSDVRFDIGDVTALQLPDGQFDTVMCYGVVISYLSPTVVLAELRRVLRPGGTLYLCINGLGWSMYLRDDRGRTDEKAAELGRKGIYHTLCVRLEHARRALVAGGVRVREAAGMQDGGLVEAVDAALADVGIHGLAPTARLIGIECGPDYETQFHADVAALFSGQTERFSHDRAGCGYDAAQIGLIASEVGFDGFRWAEEGRLSRVGGDSDPDLEPMFPGWFKGHQQVWECIVRRA